MRTLIATLKSAAGFLAQHGVETPRLDAELLLAHVLATERLQLYLQHDRPLSEPELTAYRALIKERAARRPLAYLTKIRAFHDIDLLVDERVLIPRPETEELVEHALRALTPRDAPWRVVDVGTGSGAIALALAKALPHARIVATDLSPEALHLARENAARLNLRDRVHFVHGDLLTPLLAKERRVDLVVSNPPYVGLREASTLAPELSHEPSMALFSGDDGADILRRLIPQAAHALDPAGTLLVEHGYEQGELTRSLAAACFEEVTTLRDMAGRERFLRAHQPREGSR